MSQTVEKVNIKPKPGTGARIGQTDEGKSVYVSRTILNQLKAKGWSGLERDAVALVCQPPTDLEVECDLIALTLASGKPIFAKLGDHKTKPFNGEVTVRIDEYEPTPYRGVCEGFVVAIASKVYRKLRALANASEGYGPNMNRKGHFVFECKVGIGLTSPPYELTAEGQIVSCTGRATSLSKEEYDSGLARHAQRLMEKATAASAQVQDEEGEAPVSIEELTEEALKSQRRAKEREASHRK